MVSLRDVQIDDLPLFHKWLNNPDSLGSFDEASFPSLDKIQKKFSSGGYATTWIVSLNELPVGYANFAVHPWDDWIACMGVIIAEPEFRGKGIGTQVHRLLSELIFLKFPEIHKIEAFTDTENAAEKRTLEKAGFFLEGTQRRKNKLRGQFRDMHVFAYLRPE